MTAALLGVLGTVLAVLLGWALRMLTQMQRDIAQMRMALFGDGAAEKAVLPLVEAVADLKRRLERIETGQKEVKCA
jgi:hypothetical protein